MKVMIIDDDETTLRVLEAVLEGLGHEVVARSEALGTVHAVAREKPDVAVIDVRMPGLGGDRLATLLVQGNPGLMVILHSSLPADELARVAKACRAVGFIEKRSDPSRFVDSFQRLTRERAKTSRPGRPRTG
jgi:response regulator NasT